MKVLIALYVFVNLCAFVDLVVIQGQLSALRADLRVLLEAVVPDSLMSEQE